ncbi:hypothetical protein [[Mycobacterium] nativiensis]|uniref:Uncharacterized protein n=1 Tax=[Mycobacterium] nativiensis TaxID=2855503 RepID=A0ABU5Y403_9MYCO|nr:hypothetical protein [Mycolicibacter sp. MYC340]MEB3033986.1 hypothetical protein [Mycolicibacter sp. MYC340]
MSTLQRRCAAALIGVAVGSPLIATMTSALAAADPDQLENLELLGYGPPPSQLGTDTFSGVVKDMTNPTAGDAGAIGTWTQTDENLGWLFIGTSSDSYHEYVNGSDTGDIINIYENSEAGGGTALWSNTLTETLSSSGNVIGMEDVVGLFGQEYTLFDFGA